MGINTISTAFIWHYLEMDKNWCLILYGRYLHTAVQEHLMCLSCIDMQMNVNCGQTLVTLRTNVYLKLPIKNAHLNMALMCNFT